MPEDKPTNTLKRLYGDITEEQLKKFLLIKGAEGHRSDGSTLGYLIDGAYEITLKRMQEKGEN